MLDNLDDLDDLYDQYDLDHDLSEVCYLCLHNVISAAPSEPHVHVVGESAISEDHSNQDLRCTQKTINYPVFIRAFYGSQPVELGGSHNLAGRIESGQELVRTLTGRKGLGQEVSNVTIQLGSP